MLVAEPTERAGLISCRYHCWSHTTRGELKRTPHIGGTDQHACAGFDPSQHGLRRLCSAAFMGVLFVNLSGDAPDLGQHIEPLRSRAAMLMGERGWSQLQTGVDQSQLTLQLRATWKLAVENYCEA